MGKKLTQEEFIERAQNIHKNEDGTPKYDYSLVKYVNSQTKVTITCPIEGHGEFTQNPNDHIHSKSGCQICGGSLKLTTNKFIETSQNIHKNEDGTPKYDYSLVTYVNNNTKVTIICPIEGHGKFLQKPSGHLAKSGCPICGGNLKLTTAEFIKRAQNIHKKENGEPKYDYSLSEYKYSHTKIKIICLIEGHGIFEQAAHAHTKNIGCPKCGIKSRSLKRADTNASFIEKAKIIHKNEDGTPKYNYSLVKYVNRSTKVTIICLIEGHGEFLQTPGHHLRNHGCHICGGTTKLKTYEFINNAIKIHGNKYDYSKINYINNKIKIEIVCPIHGAFWQTPHDHTSDTCGCPLCFESKGEKTIKIFLEKNSINFITQKQFEDCKNINPLKFDFYLPEYNLLIEYDGELHYTPFKENERGYKKLKQIQLHDQIKNEYCKNNNIPLLRIPYWDFKNIEKILQNRLIVNITNVEV